MLTDHRANSGFLTTNKKKKVEINVAKIRLELAQKFQPNVNDLFFSKLIWRERNLAFSLQQKHGRTQDIAG